MRSLFGGELFSENKKINFFLQIPYQEKMLSFYINIRAGVDHFLEVMNEHYEVIIYTASMSEVIIKLFEAYNEKF